MNVRRQNNGIPCYAHRGRHLKDSCGVTHTPAQSTKHWCRRRHRNDHILRAARDQTRRVRTRLASRTRNVLCSDIRSGCYRSSPPEKSIFTCPIPRPGGRLLSNLGEATETLDFVHRRRKVIQYMRGNFACLDCDTVAQAVKRLAKIYLLPTTLHALSCPRQLATSRCVRRRGDFANMAGVDDLAIETIAAGPAS